MKISQISTLVAVVGLIAVPTQAQILTNGSFETSPDLTGWSSFGGTSVLVPGTAYSNQDGTKVAAFTPATFSGLGQTFSLTPNTDYTLSALVAGDLGDDSFIRFLLADSTFGVTLIDQRQFLIAATPNGGAMSTISYSFNSSTVSLAGLQIDTFTAGGGAPRTIYLDQVNIAVVSAPEPTTLALAGLGIAGLVARRRRK